MCQKQYSKTFETRLLKVFALVIFINYSWDVPSQNPAARLGGSVGISAEFPAHWQHQLSHMSESPWTLSPGKPSLFPAPARLTVITREIPSEDSQLNLGHIERHI